MDRYLEIYMKVSAWIAVGCSIISSAAMAANPADQDCVNGGGAAFRRVETSIAPQADAVVLESLSPENGNFHSMNQRDAEAYCKSRHTRLPTLQELITAMSPNGVSPTPKKGFAKIAPKDEP